MKHILLLLIASLLGFSASGEMNCNCDWDGPFLKAAPDKPLILAAKVIGYTSSVMIKRKEVPVSMEVEVLHVLKGEEERKILTIWGGTGSQCRPFIMMFKPGDSFVFALEPAKKKNHASQYYLSGCGINWLNYFDGYAFGQITSHSYKSSMWLDYLSFKISLLNRLPANLSDSLAMNVINKHFSRTDTKLKGIYERKCNDNNTLASDQDEEIGKSPYNWADCQSDEGFFVFWEENGFIYLSVINSCYYFRRPVKLDYASAFFQFYQDNKSLLLRDRKLPANIPSGNVCADIVHLYDGNSVCVNLLWTNRKGDNTLGAGLIGKWIQSLFQDIQWFEEQMGKEEVMQRMIRRGKVVLLE